MARINIEECWWSDPRRSRLARLVGDEDKADGIAVRMWRTAQEFWGHGRKHVPVQVFEMLEHHEALLGSHLATLGPDGVYVHGSCQHLEWVAKEKEKRVAGGKKSAQRPRNAKGQLLPKVVEKPAEAPPETQVEPKWNPSEANIVQVSVSGSVSGSVSKKNTKKELKAKSASDLPPSDIGKFIGIFIKAYQARYGPKSRPDLSGKVQGEIKRYLAGIPLERACELIQVYCQIDDDWFAKKAYDFTTFAANQSKVGVALDTGQAPSTTAVPEQDPFAFMRKNLTVV